jgi:hypothetical protein
MDTKQSDNSMYNLQKKIIELTRQYYKAISDNISFESLKTIFLNRKMLEEELSELRKKNKKDFESVIMKRNWIQMLICVNGFKF